MKHSLFLLALMIAQSASANNCTIFTSQGGVESRETKTLAQCAARAITVLGADGKEEGKRLQKMDPIKGTFKFKDHEVSVTMKPVQKAHHQIPAHSSDKR